MHRGIMYRARRTIQRADRNAPAVLYLFPNARGLAGQITQVVQLRAAHVAFALHFDLRDGRAVKRKHALDALTVGNFAHRERRVEAAIAPRDDHAFERLQPFALAFLYADVHRHGVARREVRHLLAHLTRFDVLQDLAHGSTPATRWRARFGSAPVGTHLAIDAALHPA